MSPEEYIKIMHNYLIIFFLIIPEFLLMMWI